MFTRGKMKLEKSIIGYLISNPKAYNRVKHLIDTESLSREGKLIVQSIEGGSSNATDFEKDTKIPFDEITDLTINTNTDSLNLQKHCLTLRENQAAEKLKVLGDEVYKKSDNGDAFSLIDYFTNGLRSIRNRFKISSKRTKGEILEQIEADQKKYKEQGFIGITTGFTDLDKMVTFEDGCLYVLAARPGMGKTALLLSCANRQEDSGFKPGIVSIEMSDTELVYRELSKLTEKTMKELKLGKIAPDDWSKARSKALQIDIPIVSNIAKLNDIESEIHLLVNEGCRIVYIDYLQLIDSDGENMDVRTGKITRALKLLAKECGIPIILLSQLSRAVEARGGDKRPQLSDLRNSGNIEQDADGVFFLYRPEYYGISEDEEGFPTDGLAEVIGRKNRHGDIGTVYLTFKKEQTTFYDRSDRSVPDNDNEGNSNLKPNEEFGDEPF